MSSTKDINQIEFDNFDLIYFPNNSDFYSSYKKGGLLIADNKQSFLDELKRVPLKKLEYSNFWKEYAKKDIIDIFDSIMRLHLDIENMISGIPDNFAFIIRRTDNKIDFSSEVEIKLAIDKIVNNILIDANSKIKNLEFFLEKKIDILETSISLKEVERRLKAIL